MRQPLIWARGNAPITIGVDKSIYTSQRRIVRQVLAGSCPPILLLRAVFTSIGSLVEEI